jgi:uncharacterized protein YkwD
VTWWGNQRLVVTLGLVAVTLAIGCRRPTKTRPPPPAPSSAAADEIACRSSQSKDGARLEARLIALVNEARAAGTSCDDASQSRKVVHAGSRLQALAPSPALTCAARAKSRHMAETGYFAHRDLSGEGAAQRSRRAGYVGSVVENLAWGQESERDVLRAWLASPQHCEALFTPTGNDVGAGVAEGAAGKRFWTLLVGARATKD